MMLILRVFELVLNTYIKLLQYADMTGCLSDQDSARRFLKQVTHFGYFSGLILNKDKTEGMWLGSLCNSESCPFGISWPREPLRVLGVYISYDDRSCDILNFETRLGKCKCILKSWQGRNITMIGRIQIVKTFIVSQFLYVCSAVEIPECYIKKVNFMISDFIWAGRKPKLRKEILFKDKQNGGLNVPDFRIMLWVSRLRWIKGLFSDSKHAWKYFLNSFMMKNKIDLDVLLKSNYTMSTLDLTFDIPVFYFNVFDLWSKFGNTNHQKESYIWYNRELIIETKCFFIKHFHNIHINYISDLFDRNGHLYSYQYWRNKGMFRKYWLHFNSLINCVKKQKDLIRDFVSKQHNSNVILHIMDTDFLTVNSKEIYKSISHKIYGETFCIPKISKWLTECDADFDWRVPFHYIHTYVIDTKTQAFQYKFINDILVNNFWLHKWGINDNNHCDLCKVEVDDLEHKFWSCTINADFLENFRTFCYNHFNIIIIKSMFFLGHENLLLCNLIFLCKRYMYKRNQNKEVINMCGFLGLVKYTRSIECSIAQNNNKVKEHMKKWEPLSNM